MSGESKDYNKVIYREISILDPPPPPPLIAVSVREPKKLVLRKLKAGRIPPSPYWLGPYKIPANNIIKVAHKYVFLRGQLTTSHIEQRVKKGYGVWCVGLLVNTTYIY